MDSFIQRFERYARASQWIENDWATNFRALLTGKALQVYLRLSDEDAVNYQELKSNLLKTYLTEGYRRKFRQSKPEYEETGTIHCQKKKLTLRNDWNYPTRHKPIKDYEI